MRTLHELKYLADKYGVKTLRLTSAEHTMIVDYMLSDEGRKTSLDNERLKRAFPDQAAEAFRVIATLPVTRMHQAVGRLRDLANRGEITRLTDDEETQFLGLSVPEIDALYVKFASRRVDAQIIEALTELTEMEWPEDE